MKPNRITVSIVVFSKFPISVVDTRIEVFKKLICFIEENDHFLECIVVDNSKSPFFKNLIPLSGKIKYVFPGCNLGYASGHNFSRNYLFKK